MASSSSPATRSPFAPCFVQSLLQLPQDKQNLLVEALGKHVALTDKTLKLREAELDQVQKAYSTIAGERGTTEAAYKEAIKKREEKETEVFDAKTKDLMCIAQSKLSLAKNAESTCESSYRGKTAALSDVIKKINPIKEGVRNLFDLVKVPSQAHLNSIQTVLDKWSDKKLVDQAEINTVCGNMYTILTGDQGFKSIEAANKERTAILQQFATACTLCARELSPTDEKIQEIIKTTGFIPSASQELRSFCQSLSSTDLDRIFGKMDSPSRNIVEGTTRDVLEIDPLATLFANNLMLAKNLIIDLYERMNDKKNILNLNINISDKNGKPIPGLKQMDTYNALTLAANKPDPALGNELIKLGDLRLARLLLVDDAVFVKILANAFENSVEDLELLILGITKIGIEIPSKHLSTFVANSSDKATAIKALKDIKNKISKEKPPIDLKLPILIHYITLGEIQSVCNQVRSVYDGVCNGISHQSQAVYDQVTSQVPSISTVAKAALGGYALYSFRYEFAVGATSLALTKAYQVRERIPGYNRLSKRLSNLPSQLLNSVKTHQTAMAAAGCLAATALGLGYYSFGGITALTPSKVGNLGSLAGAALLGSAYELRTKIPGSNSLSGLFSGFKQRMESLTSSLFLKKKIITVGGAIGAVGQASKSLQAGSPIASIKGSKKQSSEEIVFNRAHMPTFFEAIKPENSSSIAAKVHTGIETIFSPIVGFVKTSNEKAEEFLGREEESTKMVNALCSQFGIDSTNIANCSTMLGHLEALFNWGGRIPVICNITGAWRITMGLVIGVTASAFGLYTMVLSKEEESSLIGRSIIKQYAVKQGLGNIVRGIIESSSWIISLMSCLPRDLCGLRWSYEGETFSRLNITPMIKDMADTVKEKLNGTESVAV